MIIIEFIIWKFFKHELKIIKWIQIVSKYQNNRTLKKNSPFYLLHSGVETIIKFTYHMKNWTINKTNWARWRIRLEEEISDRGGGGGGVTILRTTISGCWALGTPPGRCGIQKFSCPGIYIHSKERISFQYFLTTRAHSAYLCYSVDSILYICIFAHRYVRIYTNIYI